MHLKEPFLAFGRIEFGLTDQVCVKFMSSLMWFKIVTGFREFYAMCQFFVILLHVNINYYYLLLINYYYY